MNSDEFILSFDEYARRHAARRKQRRGLKPAGAIFATTEGDLADTYSPGETEDPNLMPHDTVLRWLIRESIRAFGEASIARTWFHTPHQQLEARPIDLVCTHAGAVSVFRALPESPNPLYNLGS